MGQQEADGENRAYNRVPYQEEIRVLSPQQVSGIAVDIGAGGIGVEIPVKLDQGTEVELEIMSGHAITHGTVRWTGPIEGGFRTGIQFRSEDWSIIEIILSLRSQEA